MRKIAIVAASALLAVSLSASAADKQTAADAINSAVTAVQAAGKAGGEWRDSYKMIGKAKAAYQKGDYAKAAKLASEAKAQGELGVAQAEAEKNADVPSYITAGK